MLLEKHRRRFLQIALVVIGGVFLLLYLKLRSHRRIKKVFLVEKGDYKGQPISVRGIQKRMEYYAKKTGLKISCHRLRHTMATQLLNADAEGESIQDLLGHNWITTTQRYCQVSNMKVKRDFFNAMGEILNRSAQRSSKVFNRSLVFHFTRAELDFHKILSGLQY